LVYYQVFVIIDIFTLTFPDKAVYLAIKF